MGLLQASSGYSREAAKHPAVHINPLIKNNYPAPNVNNSEAKKPWYSQYIVAKSTHSGVIDMRLNPDCTSYYMYELEQII